MHPETFRVWVEGLIVRMSREYKLISWRMHVCPDVWLWADVYCSLSVFLTLILKLMVDELGALDQIWALTSNTHTHPSSHPMMLCNTQRLSIIRLLTFGMIIKDWGSFWLKNHLSLFCCHHVNVWDMLFYTTGTPQALMSYYLKSKSL